MSFNGLALLWSGDQHNAELGLEQPNCLHNEFVSGRGSDCRASAHPRALEPWKGMVWKCTGPSHVRNCKNIRQLRPRFAR